MLLFAPPGAEFLEADLAGVIGVDKVEGQGLFFQGLIADEFVHHDAEFVPVDGAVFVFVELIKDLSEFFNFFLRYVGHFPRGSWLVAFITLLSCPGFNITLYFFA